MEPTMNLIPTPSSAVDGGVNTDEMTKLPLASPHSSEKENGVDLGHERATESEPNDATDTENGSESVDKNQSPETIDVVRVKDLQTEPDSLDDDVEIVIKNQHKYYIYCPCCGEDITKTVKLVKKSDLQPTKKSDTENEAIDTKNGSRYKDKKIKFPSWFPVNLHQLFHSLYRHGKDKGKKEVDLKSPTVPSIDLGIDDKEPIEIEKEKPSFPKWYLDAFAWLFLCIIIIALSVLFTSIQQSPSVLSTFLPPFILPHPQLPSVSSLQLPSASVLLLLPTFAVLFLVIMAMRTRYSPRFQKEKGDESIDSKSSDTASVEQSRKAADPGQEADKKTDNQKVHPAPLNTSPHEQPSMQIIDKETHENAESETPAKTQAEPELQSKHTPLEITNSVEEPLKGGTKLEILKSIVYGGLTESITSLCTVTSAAASGATTLNIFALGVANLSSGLLLIVHNLQELINEKPRKRTNSTDDQTNSEEEERDRYEEILGRREKSKLHSFIAISSFFVCGIIPPLVYCFSFRQRFEKRQEYKTLAVYGVSLVCVVLLSIAKAYASKRPEYLKTLFRYTAMATTASGLSQFVGYLVSRWLEKSGFYDDYPQTTPRF